MVAATMWTRRECIVVPPQRFQAFDTDDPDELATWLSRLFGRAWVDLQGCNAKFHCRIRYLSFGDIGIIHGQYNSGFKISIPDFDTFVGSPAPLTGTGTHEIGGKKVTVSKGCGAILSPGDAKLNFGTHFEHLSLIVPPAVLTGKLAAIVGDLHLGALHFDPKINNCTHQANLLARLLGIVGTEVSGSLPMPPIMQSELQQAMITSLLLASTNNYSGLLHGEPMTAAPWQVRRAEQYIETNWDQPITIEALVAATNISARSLFSSFKAGRGYSPMDFVKRVRLRHARQKLSTPDVGTSVSAVAFECGFGNPGHFAGDYHHHFGERPSDTLRRSRSGHNQGNKPVSAA